MCIFFSTYKRRTKAYHTALICLFCFICTAWLTNVGICSLYFNSVSLGRVNCRWAEFSVYLSASVGRSGWCIVPWLQSLPVIYWRNSIIAQRMANGLSYYTMRPLLSWNSHFCVSYLAGYKKEHPCHVGNCFDLLRVLPFLFFCWCHIPCLGIILFFLVLVQFCLWIFCHEARPSLVPCRHNYLLKRILQVKIFLLAMTFFQNICTSVCSSHEYNTHMRNSIRRMKNYVVQG